jgi:dTDP-4-amino-4,6-dideoxygalactose transaminase
MHTFGHPVIIDKIKEVCDEYNIPLIEDAAESIGSYYKSKHTGTFGLFGILSFNGNKLITTGGGGMILTDDEDLAKRAKHITTTAKIPHPWEYAHDQIAYNYRLTNIHAALGCAQIENLDFFVNEKRKLAEMYKEFFKGTQIQFFSEPGNCRANYWLNAIILEDRKHRDEFLEYTNKNGIMTRPIWKLMNKLPAFSDCQCGDISNAKWLEDRVVNIPSSVIIKDYHKK